MRATAYFLGLSLIVGGCAVLAQDGEETANNSAAVAEGVTFTIKGSTARSLYEAMVDVVIPPNGAFFPQTRSGGVVTAISAERVTCTDKMRGVKHFTDCTFEARGRTEKAHFEGQSFNKLQFYAVAFTVAFDKMGELGGKGADDRYEVSNVKCTLKKGKHECTLTDVTKKPADPVIPTTDAGDGGDAGDAGPEAEPDPARDERDPARADDEFGDRRE